MTLPRLFLHLCRILPHLPELVLNLGHHSQDIIPLLDWNTDLNPWLFICESTQGTPISWQPTGWGQVAFLLTTLPRFRLLPWNSWTRSASEGRDAGGINSRGGSWSTGTKFIFQESLWNTWVSYQKNWIWYLELELLPAILGHWQVPLCEESSNPQGQQQIWGFQRKVGENRCRTLWGKSNRPYVEK